MKVMEIFKSCGDYARESFQIKARYRYFCVIFPMIFCETTNFQIFLRNFGDFFNLWGLVGGVSAYFSFQPSLVSLAEADQIVYVLKCFSEMMRHLHQMVRNILPHHFLAFESRAGLVHRSLC